MTKEKDDELDIKIKELKQKISKAGYDIDNFDTENRTPKELQELFNILERCKEEASDIEDEIAVMDFLENGPGIKDKNI